MKRMQYTIRSVPPQIDKALRTRAQKTGKSLNEVVLETLARATGVNRQSEISHDLDWFIGNKSIDKSFDDALEWLDSAPKEIK